jgi:hypothetical protein
MSKRPIGIISFGGFLFSCAIALLLYQLELVNSWEIVPILFILNGVWVMILAAIKGPAKYEMTASTMTGWGIVLLTLGLTGMLWSRVSIEVALMIFCTMMGGIVVAAGAKMRKSSRR